MLIDLHNHTLPRSSDSSLRVEELILQAKTRGLDGVCLTEHDNTWNSKEVERISKDNGFLVIAGMEVTTDHGHILVFGVNKFSYEMFTAERLRRIVEEEGGVMVLAHPFRRSLYKLYSHGHTPSPNGGMSWAAQDHDYLNLVEAVEVLNGTGSPHQNAFSLEVAQRLGLPGTGGSDAHHRAEIAACVTKFERDIAGLSELMNELRSGEFSALDLRIGGESTRRRRFSLGARHSH